MWLKSDNIAGVDPAIFAAMAQCNVGVAPAYGSDPLSSQLNASFSDLFGTAVEVFPVPSGTAANALCLASLAGPFNLIVCHQDAHPLRSESGATTAFSGGAQFMPVPGEHGRMQARQIAAALDALQADSYGAMKPSAITLTQLTEAGTAYSAEQVREIGELARARGLLLHMDGARFANAMAAANCSPAEMTWRAGVDVMSFGATKNGTMYADAVVFFNPGRAEGFRQRLKRGGLALSKSRFMAAQLLSYVESGRWLHNAGRANAAAQQISAAISALPGAELLHPVEGNMVFAAIGNSHVELLARAGLELRRKGRLSDGRQSFRLVTSFQTDAAEAGRLGDILGRA